MAPKKKSQRVAREGFVILAAPEDVGACSASGVTYEADADGLVEVPVADVAALAEHGFAFVSAAPAPDAPAPPPSDGDPPPDNTEDDS